MVALRDVGLRPAGNLSCYSVAYFFVVYSEYDETLSIVQCHAKAENTALLILYAGRVYTSGVVIRCTRLVFLLPSHTYQSTKPRLCAPSTSTFARSYREGRHERPPYTKETLRTVYYVRELEIFKLAQVRYARVFVFPAPPLLPQ